ncbi:low molecular weight phosphotyrosine protein phosphatase [Gordonia sp. L191]|uniref:arsenate reductase/protein-tyrosine-phosphatase family protein n=1 Tax=Gordonia sp. L191 TaxID=2982699 RepID=UPI0024BF4809|nr:low molecular weight phosphotyrosine protein phosphatase [Gordonia sp. L191]WHU45896.1 low molecular weight phosphotyrosine protein phosphatase [Gordonia sp. L191]
MSEVQSIAGSVGSGESDDRPSSILFVCTGNICRSPIAERILRTLAGTAGVPVTVSSAGVGAQNGAPMHPLSVEVLDEHGYDAAGFEARYLRPQILDDADLVLAMTREHRAACQRTTPVRWKRMFTLNEFVELVGELDGAGLSTVIDSRARIGTNAERLDIVDPMGQPKEAFERVFAEIEPRVLEVAAWVAGGSAVELPSGRVPKPVEPVGDDGASPVYLESASSGDETLCTGLRRNWRLCAVLGMLFVALVVIGVVVAAN